MKTATKQQLMTAIDNHPMGKFLKLEVQPHYEDINGCGRVLLEVDYDGRVQLDDASVYIAMYCPESGDYRGTAYADIIDRLNDHGFVNPMTEELADGLGIDL